MEWKRSTKISFSNNNKNKIPSSFCSVNILFFFCCCCLSFSAFFTSITTASLDVSCAFPDKAADRHFKEIGKSIGDDKERVKMDVSAIVARRVLSGPGSSPPRCKSKCGKCNPCKPVHVPVPPGTPVTAEYYPEAWRCKCGNKLYMP